MAKNRNTAAQAAPEAAAQAPQTLAQVLGKLPNTARTAAPVQPPKAAGSACGRAWVVTAYAAKQGAKRPSGEELRQLAGETGLNQGNVAQEASRYFRWLAQQGHAESSGILPQEWGISL